MLGVVVWSGSHFAQQRATTFREALISGGVADLNRFHVELLDSPIPDPRPGRRYILADVHVTPSASRLLVFSTDRKLVRELNGWELAALPNETILYHESQVHFAPTHVLEISVFDPTTGIDRNIYPPASPSAVRTNFIESVSSVYKEIGADWFRENNHHMDPARFNSALIDRVTVDEKAGSMTFLVRFGNREIVRDPILFSELVRVTCAPLAPADCIECREAPAK
jgi:hypothetical protein